MIVALESASSDPSLAVATSDGTILASDSWAGEGRQASELMPHLLALLRASGLEIGEVTALAVGTGPGSFTGLRVSMSVAKGLALATGSPLVGVPSLEAWLAGEPEAMAAISRAGAQEAYLLLRGEVTPRVMSAEDLTTHHAGTVVVAPSELASAFGLGAARSPRNAAAAIAFLAASRLARDPAGDSLEHLEPAYLRGPRGITPSTAEVTRWP